MKNFILGQIFSRTKISVTLPTTPTLHPYRSACDIGVHWKKVKFSWIWSDKLQEMSRKFPGKTAIIRYLGNVT